jgi:hypothetical protein
MTSQRRPRRAILRVLLGKAAARKVVIEPGGLVRVGRNEDLELCLAHDRELSANHFAVDFTGEHIRLRDNASFGGTSVNGLPFTAGVVDPGSYIKAGETLFRVFVEAATPPLEPNRDPVRLEKAKTALASLRVEQAEQPIFGVFDAARDARILALLDEGVDESWSLYEGIEGAALEAVAPHLVRFLEDSELLDRLIEEGWGLAWGIYFAARRPAKDIRRHLRRFLMVEPDDSRERLYFRYYDPRVLRDFLPIATPRQKSEFFGDISVFLLEDPNADLVRIDPFESTEDDDGPNTITGAPTSGGTHVPHP